MLSLSGRRAVAVLTLVALAACRKADRAPAPPRATALSLLPADTLLVISVDLGRLRKTPLLAKLAVDNPLPAPLLELVDAFTEKSGIDPWRTFDSVVFAAGANENWALVARGQRLDEARLEAAARRALSDRGGKLVGEKRGLWTFWSAGDQPGVQAFLPDERTLVVAGGGWTAQVAALAGGGAAAGSAASNPTLSTLCQEVSQRPVWAAAIVSEQLRDQWLDDLQTQHAAYLDRMSLGLDVGAGLEGTLTLTLTEAAQAEALAEALANWLVRARHQSQSSPLYEGLLKGVTTYVDGKATFVNVALGEGVLVPWARMAARYWRFLGASLPEPSRRATPLRLVQGAATAGSGAVAFGDARIFTTWENEPYALIEVTNRTNRPLSPALRLMFRRQSGDMLSPGFCAFPLGTLLAREKAVCVGVAPPGAVSANYEVLLGDAKAGAARTALKVVAAQLSPPAGPFQWVAGRVKNDSRAMLEHPQVHVAFYDAGGKLVGYGRDDLDGKPLLPGTEASFQASSLVLMPAAATSFTVATSVLGDGK
jgi:hypothetical protein